MENNDRIESTGEDKYYTPSIEEFYVGFEYERLQEGDDTFRVDDEWESMDLSNDKLPYVSKWINRKEVRVKYLDVSDIESLGFEYIGKAIDDWYSLKGEFQIGSWTSYEIRMHYGCGDKRLFINAVDQGASVPLFQGIIKNKSELIKLLKQLGIL